jgi:type I restriction enzyme S subunit
MAIARDLPQTSKTTFQKSVALLKPKKNIVNPFFLYYNLFSRRTELQNTAGGTTQQNLLLGDLKRFQILLPPLPLQRRIAEILGALDDKIELNSQMNQTLEEMAQALYKHYFVDDIDPENLPDGWVIATIENYLSTISKTHKFPNPDIIFLNTSDVYNGFVLHSNYSDVGTLPGQAKKSIRFGDILYSEIRPENRRFAYIDFEAEDYVVSTKLMVLRTKTDINSIFFYFLLTRPNIINDLQNQAEARSGTFPQITFDQIKEIQFILPTNEFLNSFIDGFLFPAYKMIFANNEENQQLISIRDTLLPRLISGEFIPSDLQTIESAL